MCCGFVRAGNLTLATPRSAGLPFARFYRHTHTHIGTWLHNVPVQCCFLQMGAVALSWSDHTRECSLFKSDSCSGGGWWDSRRVVAVCCSSGCLRCVRLRLWLSKSVRVLANCVSVRFMWEVGSSIGVGVQIDGYNARVCDTTRTH